MNSVRRLSIVVLLTIAGSLLLTEARYHGEDSVPAKHRHRHHREEILSSTGSRKNHERLTMKKHPLDQNDEEYDAFEIYGERRARKKFEEEDDEDEEDEEDYDDYERYTIRHSRARHEDDRRRNQRRGHRTRPDSRLYHGDYPPRSHDRVSPAEDPNDTKDDAVEFDEYVKPRYRPRYRHHQRHHHNELYVPRWRNSWIDDGRVDVKNLKTTLPRRKSKYKHVYGSNNYSSIYHNNKTRITNSVEDRKWRNNNLRREDERAKEYRGKINDDDDDEDIWSELGDYDDTDLSNDTDDGINDDYFEDIVEEHVEKPPYKTYEEIIRRLTSDEPTTRPPALSVKRDYRNIEIERFLKRDAYGNLKYDPINGTRPELAKISNVIATTEGKKLKSRGKTKSLEQDYADDYASDKREENETDDAEEEYDIDVRNDTVTVENTVIDGEMENETSAPVQPTTSPTPGTTRGVRTTTSRPVITITTQKTYDRRDSRNNSTGTTQQSNGLQSIRSGQKLETKEFKIQPHQTKKSAEIREAIQHAIKVSREGSCQWPRARVIPVRDVYPSPSTTYIPHCAILHRCSDDTGCCRSEALTCVPKQSHRVELYFYTTSVSGGSVVEKLSFYNHTECECREKSDYGIVNGRQSTRHQFSSPPQNIRITPQKKPCRCPSEFTPRITPDGECQCKCFESDDECIRARRGKVFFSASDRLCIQREECAMPTCEFGEYMIRQGKCPKKKDKIESIANYPNNYHHRLRS